MPFHHAATQNTPLKLRTMSVPTTGKIFKVHEVNQDLLVELHGVTLHEDPLSTPHYVLELCDNISPTVIQSLLLQSRTSPLKIKSLKLKDEYLYHNGCWEPMKVPNLLRSPATSSSRHDLLPQAHVEGPLLQALVLDLLPQAHAEGPLLQALVLDLLPQAHAEGLLLQALMLDPLSQALMEGPLSQALMLDPLPQAPTEDLLP